MLPDGLADRLLHRLPHRQLKHLRLLHRPRQQNHLRRLHPLRRQPRQRSNESCFIDLATGFKSARKITRADIFLSLVKKRYSAPSGRMTYARMFTEKMVRPTGVEPVFTT